MKKKLDCSFEARACLLGLNHLLGYDHCQMGNYLLEKRMYPEAQSEFQKAVDINPGLKEAWLGLARIAELNNDIQKKMSTKKVKDRIRFLEL